MNYKTMKFKDAYNDYFLLKENDDILSRLHFVTTSIDGESYIVLALDNLKIVGTYAFENYDNDNIFTLYIQVDKQYQNRGIATQLIQEVFDWALSHDKGIISSQFSQQGEKFIKNKLKCLSDEYQISYYNSIEEFDWCG